MNALSRNQLSTSTSLNKRLLLTAATSALLCFGTAANAANCSINAGLDTISCVAGPGTYAAVGAVDLTQAAGLTVNLAAGANIPDVLNVGAGTKQFTLSVVGNTTVAGSISVLPGNTGTVAGNTATVTNAGALSSLVLGSNVSAFGDLITVTNQASGTISIVNTHGVAGSKVNNTAGGTIGSLYLDTLRLAAVGSVTPRAYDTTSKYSTSVTDATWANVGGLQTINNDGAITGPIDAWGSAIVLNNTGTITGTTFLIGRDSYGLNSEVKTTTVYLDTTNTGTVDDTKGTAGTPDDWKQTIVTEMTPWGGGVKVVNSGTLSDLTASAIAASSLENSKTITGNLYFDVATDIHDLNSVATHATDDGNTITVTVTTADTKTPVGSTLTITNDATGDIDGNVTALGLTSATLVNDGVINKGPAATTINVSSTGVQTVLNQQDITTWSDTKAVPWTATPTVDAGPPVIVTNVWKGSKVAQYGNSETKTTTKTSVGGAASFTNDATGTIGVTAAPTTVSVTGDTTSDAVNAGTIVGSLDVRSLPSIVVATNNYSNQYVDPAWIGDNWSGTETTKQDTTNGYWPSDVFHYNQTSSWAKTSEILNSTDFTGGEASLKNAAKASISGSVSVVSDGAASINNLGTILGNVTVGDTLLGIQQIDNSTDTKTSDTKAYSYTHDFTDLDTLSGGIVSYNNFDHFVTDNIRTITNTITTTSGTNGSTASLINDTGAVIGAQSALVAVNVNGEKSATASNIGTLYGSLNVQAYDYTTTETKTNPLVTNYDSESKKDTSVNHIGSAGVDTEFKWTDAAVKGGDTYNKYWATTSDVKTTTENASSASVTNSGLIWQGVTVGALTSAGLDNSGTILGGVRVSTYDTNGNIANSTTNKTGHLYTSTASHDEVYTKASGGDAIDTDTYNSDVKTNDVYDATVTHNLTTPQGGDATLINEAAGVIGASATKVLVNVSANGKATLTNAGKIYGVSGAGTLANGVWGYSSLTSTDTISNKSNVVETTVAGTHVQDTTLGKPLSNISDTITTRTYDQNYTTTTKYLSNGGSAVLTNAAKATLAGDWYVWGYTTASADNAGSISGALEVDTGRYDQVNVSSNGDKIVSTDEVKLDDEFAYPAPDATETYTSNETYNWTETVTKNGLNYNNTSTLLGSDASLTNETGATLGTAGDEALVFGVASSTLTNAGTITGNAYVGRAVTGSAQSGWFNNPLASTVAISSDVLKTTNGVQTWGYLDTFKNGVQLTRNDTNTYGYTNDEAIVVTNDTVQVGGAATYNGTGALYGSLYLSSVGDATVTNSAALGAKAGGGVVSVVSSGFATVGSLGTPDSIESIHTDYAYHYSDTSADLTKAESVIYGAHTYTKDTLDTVYSSTNIGGAALLTNTATGVIGGDATVPINVTVFGTKSATLNNLGHISGNATVQSTATDNKVTKHEVKTDDRTYSHDDEYTYATKAPTNVDTFSYGSHEVATDNYTITTLATQVGGAAVATNTSSWTITGNLNVNGTTSATVTNSGQIWGNVGVTTAPGQNSNVTETFGSTITTDFTDVGATTVPSVISGLLPNEVTTTTTVTASNDDKVTKLASVGGDSVVNNTGTIGLRIDNTAGLTTVSGGAVTLTANGNATVSNAAGAIIYGTVSGTASGNTDNTEVIDTYNNKDILTATTVTSLATLLNPAATTVTTTDTKVGTETVTTVETRTQTGGTASLTNNGVIGQRFASLVSGGVALTPAGGVNLHGDKAATLTNTNLIGGGAIVVSDVSNYTDTKTAPGLLNPSSWNSTASLSAAGTRTASWINTETQIWTAVGGVASITNSGKIGPDVYANNANLVGLGSTIYVNGDTSASITNSAAGLIQASGGNGIQVISDVRNHKQVYSDTVNETDTGNKSLTPTWTMKSRTETSSQTDTFTPVGGTAVITNAGTIKAQAGNTLPSLGIYAYGFGGATITNSGTIDTVGNSGGGLNWVGAESWDRGEVVTDNWKLVQSTGSVQVSYTDTKTDVTTAAGGTGLVDNTGTIKGNAWGEGFALGKVLNETGAKITGIAEADSYGWNYDSLLTVNQGLNGVAVAGDAYHEYYKLTGNNAVVDNYGSIGSDAFAQAAVSATVINRAQATIGGTIRANSLFTNLLNDGPTTGSMVTGGVVTTTPFTGGVSVVNNYGTVSKGFDVESYNGSTLTNNVSAAIDTSGSNNSFIYTYNTAATNTFTNVGTIGYVPPVFANIAALLEGLSGLSIGTGVIEFRGNTVATNTGIIDERLLFTDSEGVAAGTHSTASFTFASGSIVTGDINNPSDLANNVSTPMAPARLGPTVAHAATTLANLTLTFDGTGLYQGNIYGATTTNKTGAGTWILTGSALGVGNATISAGLVEIGTPLNYFAAQPTATVSALLSALGLSSSWDPLQGVNPYAGNTAISPNLQGQTVSSSLIYQLASAPVVTGNITINSGAGLEGRAIFVGNITNAGTFLAGWQLAPSTAALSNLLDNSNQVLPAAVEVTGNYTQTGTLITNLAPAVNRPTRLLVGTQASLFAPTNYWLSVAPFAADLTPTSFVTVDGKATVGGTVKVYVNKGGLYVNGQTAPILASTGALAVTATATPNAPSLFVSFGLATSVSGGKNVLSVVTNRTSYSSVATTANEANIGKALDSAVPSVAAAIKSNTFASVADFTAAQDMAGFLADMDWQVTSSSQAAQILGSLSPDDYASLAAIDTGAGFKNQLTYRLTRLPGAAASDVATGAWIKAYGVAQNIDGHNGAGKLSGATVGTSLGWDVALDNFVLGIAAGYSRTTIDTSAKTFDGAINAYQVGAYAEGTWNALYVNATLWANFGNGHVTRTLTSVADRVATASVKPSEFRADIEGGWRFSYNTTGITPYINLSVRDAKLDNVTEAGAGGLGYKLSNIGSTYFTPQLGVRFDDRWTVSNLVAIEPLVGLGIAFQPKADDITAQFLGGGDPFQVNGAVDSNVAFTPDAGLNILIGRSVSLQLSYSGAIGSNRSSHGGWIGLRGNW